MSKRKERLGGRGYCPKCDMDYVSKDYRCSVCGYEIPARASRKRKWKREIKEEIL